MLRVKLKERSTLTSSPHCDLAGLDPDSIDLLAHGCAVQIVRACHLHENRSMRGAQRSAPGKAAFIEGRRLLLRLVFQSGSNISLGLHDSASPAFCRLFLLHFFCSHASFVSCFCSRSGLFLARCFSGRRIPCLLSCRCHLGSILRRRCFGRRFGGLRLIRHCCRGGSSWSGRLFLLDSRTDDRLSPMGQRPRCVEERLFQSTSLRSPLSHASARRWANTLSPCSPSCSNSFVTQAWEAPTRESVSSWRPEST